MEKKKICLVIPSLQAGGMERVMSELADFFCTKNNLEVHLILYGRSPEIFFQVTEKLIIHKPETKFNARFRSISAIGRLIYLRRTIRKVDPYAILSFGELWNSFVLLSLYWLSYPVYISDRCSPIRNYKLPNKLLRRILYPRSAGIIAQTEIAKEIYFTKFRHHNIKVIGNPIRTIWPENELERENIVLMVGRLINSKNQDKLIELFLKINIPGWRLFIVGYDHLHQSNYDRLNEIIIKNNAEDRVILTGKQSDVDQFYLRSRVFAFTSSSEGFPNAIGEAMSAGLPVVAFDCVAGPSELIKDKHNGFLIPIFDYDLFRQKLELLMSNEDLRTRFGKNAREDIGLYSVSAIGEKFLQFILIGSQE